MYGELVIGDMGGRRALLANYTRMDHAPLVPHAEVVAFVRDRRLKGHGIGWIDAHLQQSVDAALDVGSGGRSLRSRSRTAGRLLAMSAQGRLRSARG